MDRFDAMRAFARVVEAGSFTKAAQTLHMSKTTVTQLIQQLESRLRVRLLHRTTRKLGVTPDGAVYYERVIRLLADMEDAENSLSSAAMTPRGRLRVDVPSPLARMLLHSDSFRAMTERVQEAADRLCGGKLVMVHEGGYAESYVPFCGLAVMEALSGVKTEVEDPLLAFIQQQQPREAFTRFQRQAIDELAHRFGLK